MLQNLSLNVGNDKLLWKGITHDSFLVLSTYEYQVVKECFTLFKNKIWQIKKIFSDRFIIKAAKCFNYFYQNMDLEKCLKAFLSW